MHEEDQIKPDFRKSPQNPFRTPDNYFESLEDRIMENLGNQATKQKSTTGIIRFLRPVLALAASFALIFMLVYYPINTFLIKDSTKTVQNSTSSADSLSDFSINLVSMDENSLVNALLDEETNSINETNADELLAYLSSGVNEVDIYAEIQN